MGRTIAPQQQWRAQKFTASGTFTVPTLLYGGVIFVSGTAPGGGGCSGLAAWSATTHGTGNDYQNGGSSAQSCYRVPVPCTAGDSITVTIGVAGSGGAAVSRTTAGATVGNPGSNGTNNRLTLSGNTVLYLWPGVGATWATGGGGVAYAPAAAAGVSNGQDGADDAVTPVPVGASAAGAEGVDETVVGTSLGGHPGASSAYGRGGDGGRGDSKDAADALGTDGGTGGWGSGGGGGGAGGVSNATTETATSGAGGDGGPGFFLIEWLESVS